MERRSACLFIAVSDHQSSGVWGPRISGTGCQAGLRPGEENVNDCCGLWAHQQHLCVPGTWMRTIHDTASVITGSKVENY